MSKQLVALGWDDIHRVDEGRLVKGPNERSLTINGETYYWDFTDEHAAEFDATLGKLIGYSGEHHKANKPRTGSSATAVMEDNGDVTMLDNPKAAKTTKALAALSRSKTVKGLSIRDPERREHVRKWGIPKGLAKTQGKLSIECQQAFMKEFGLADINDPINQKELGVLGA